MSDYYDLIGQTPVRVDDVVEWARRFEIMNRRVDETDVRGLCRVSTVFLGLDHGWRGPPILFETMAFWPDGTTEMKRCSTWLEAEAQHKEMCAEVEKAIKDRQEAVTELDRVRDAFLRMMGIEP